MKIGCPKEIKPQEFRVGLTPAAAREAVAHGHDVLIETGAGHGAGFEIPTTSPRGPQSLPARRRSSPRPT
jgi:alanine dehydrogenase